VKRRKKERLRMLRPSWGKIQIILRGKKGEYQGERKRRGKCELTGGRGNNTFFSVPRGKEKGSCIEQEERAMSTRPPSFNFL